MDAKNFFDLADSKIPPLRKNQFGAAQSGPVVRDKLFYFLNYEGIRQTASRTVSPVTITEEARQGRLPLAGGGWRTAQVAPAILPYLDLFPLPNGRDFGDGTAEYINESVTPTREDYLSGKGDVIFSDRLRVGAHYTFDDSGTTSPDPFQVWQFDSDSRHHFIHTDTRMIHSPSTSSSIGAAFSRIGYADTSRQRASISPSLSFVEGRPLGGIQVVGLSDFGGLNVQLRPRTFLMDDTQVNYQLTHLRGAHAIQFGTGFDRVRLDQMSDNNANGRYRFTSLLNFLEGRPQSGDLMVPGSDTKRTWRQAQFHAFVQDEYRVGPRLSISVGVRYEAYSVPVEQDNKIATLPQPWTDPAVTTGAPLFVNPSKRNFAPRASIALDPWGGGRTVLRAGAGIFFDLLGARELAVAGLRMPPFFLRVTPANPAFPNLLAAAAGASPANSLDGLEYYVHQPYVSQYQFAVQHQVGSDVVLELGYAGARGVHLPGKLGNINSSSPTRLADGRVFFPAGAPRINPAFGQIGMRLMQFNSFYHGLNASMRRRWKGGFTGQAKYTWSKSIDEVSSATFDDYVNSDGMPMIFDYRQNRGPSDFDLRHVFAVSFSWEIPSPRRGGVWRHLGGWGLYGVGRLQSGHPFNPSVGFDRAGLRPATGDLGQRPDFAAAPGSPLVLGNPQRYFDTTAFALPDRGFYGNLGRNVLTGPGMVSLDLALHKTLWSTERQSVRLRLEAFNIANRPNFQLPSDLGLFNSSGQRVGSAGRISSTTTTSRQIQIALRWMF